MLRKDCHLGLLPFLSQNLDLPFTNVHFVMLALSDIVCSRYIYSPIVYAALPLHLNMLFHAQNDALHQSDTTKPEILLQIISLSLAIMYSWNQIYNLDVLSGTISITWDGALQHLLVSLLLVWELSRSNICPLLSQEMCWYFLGQWDICIINLTMYGRIARVTIVCQCVCLCVYYPDKWLWTALTRQTRKW